MNTPLYFTRSESGVLDALIAEDATLFGTSSLLHHM